MSGFSANNNSSKTSNGPVIAGVVAGLIVGICVVVGGFLYGRRKSRRHNRDGDIELGHAPNGEPRRGKPSDKGGDGDRRKDTIASTQLSTSSTAERARAPSRQQRREEAPAPAGGPQQEDEEIPVSRYPAI
jgi:hypothetical protein